MELKIKYKDKKYNNLIEPVAEIMIKAVKDHFKEALKPFEKEIVEYHGIVTIDIPKDFKNATFKITNIPDDLMNKIISTLK